MRASIALVLVLGCGSSESAASPDTAPLDAGSDTRPAEVAAEVPEDVAGDAADEAEVADAAPPTTVPPPRPTATGTGTTKWYAFKRVDLGGFDRTTHAASTTAWKTYGYDLDGRITTAADSADSKGTCKRNAGSSSTVLTDGNGGIDNNFGSRLLPIIGGLSPDAEKIANDNLAAGQWTLVLRLDNVGPDDNSSVPGAMYVGHSYDGSSWQIADVSTTDGATVSKPKVRFPDGYMAGGTWVSGDLGKATIPITLVMFGVPTVFPLESGIVTVRVKDGKLGTMAGGTLGSDLLAAFTPLLESFGVCKGSTNYELFSKAVAVSVDLVSKAPMLQDETRDCNAMSSGLGFEMGPTAVPTVVAPVPKSPPSLCP